MTRSYTVCPSRLMLISLSSIAHAGGFAKAPNAEWCGPCRMMAPVFAEAAAHVEPRARFVKVDTEQAQRTAARFAIRSIPTLAIFHRGKIISQQAGALPRQQFLAWVEHNLPD
ncbi:MAG: hypothetical protein CME40_04450 [Haliea sp.]|nr:hypothetical protein [Haliea sp.]